RRLRIFFIFAVAAGTVCAAYAQRERVSINHDWWFTLNDPEGIVPPLRYDVRPEVGDTRDDRPADTEPTEAEKVAASQNVLKPWILPTGNPFLKDPAKRITRPATNPPVQPLYADPA